MDYAQRSDLSLYREYDNRYAGLQSRFGVERDAVARIPIVDISALTSPSTLAERRVAAAQIRKACIDIGFFYIKGHGFTPAELERAIDLGMRFFELPIEEKMKVNAKNSPTSRGWIQTGGVNPDKSPEKTPDIKERFMASCNKAPGGPRDNQQIDCQWPEKPAGFEAFMRDHILKRVRLAQQLARGFALSVDLGEDFLDPMFDRLGATLAMNYYPSVDPEKLAPTQWSFSPHTDYGAFTLLTQDRVGGLQARNCDGEWIDIPPLEGAFIVNVGDLMARWTNDLYASSLHRAMNDRPAARLSLAFFTTPNGDAVIDCLPTCHGPGNPKRYEPVVTSQYNNALVAQSHLNGRPGLSSATEQRFEKH